MGAPAGASGVVAVAGTLEPYLGPLADIVVDAAIFLAVVTATYVLYKAAVKPLVRRVFDRQGLDEHARRPLQKIVAFLVLFAGVTVAFGAAGYQGFLRSLATIAAAATLAIGFALQDVIKNFVAGVFIYTDKPFRIGDWIEWNGNSGVVEDISFRVTRVRTFDNELLTVPNHALTSDVVKNPVAKKTLRLKFVFGIDYEDDVEKATDIIVEEAERSDAILEDPAPSVRLTELADSYVGLQSRIWIDDPSRADFVKARADYVKAVKARFDEAGISIPFPQRTVSGRNEWTDPSSFGGDD
ncbi:mechanosensitive ion channel family protein [Halorubrum ezzemoulense]|jgi:small-conductance mechanosensitive channel|uniref:Mechanosensitive ion channel n=2 Tax=Halorubrum ezzemoulense TaxID=337243 RepID=A0A256KDQ7_HALEZ|nr:MULTISPECIES: mechanosensitive ion channel family protein [Halorubrum]MDB2236739.1 mechanosensitive ion channel family protein [Halorubrum ezzemoulense]MDB2247272.1 mechanosensitive ion channel family protein [Halorubrum ezzemoulense]MDB2260867.1 mechanosensitive ion channel family protein [Halorubrum ezzemoulense]MDB2265438.1 mechanosensitive ion channel family protein [Halorubrum ezzemoulense]MDB2267861.1 mechanosensitive ion channel family protein [Halorubrum ezzemoulense]